MFATQVNAYNRWFVLCVGDKEERKEGCVMPEATVTISVDEYFDLRQKAETNGMLIKELGEIQGRLYDFDRRIFELEQRTPIKEG